MTQACKNCNHHFKGNYCDNCGQSSETHKLDFEYLWHEIQHGFFHFDKGVLYTSKELFKRPGHSIREFIDGKRINHFKPLSYVIVLATLYGFLYHFFIKEAPAFIVATTSDGDPRILLIPKINEWIITHYAIISLLTLPLSALCSFWAFKKSGYNYVENLIMNAFLLGQCMVLKLLFFPFVLLFDARSITSIFSTLPGLLGVGLTFWTYMQFYNNLKMKQRFWRTILSYVYFGLIFFSLCIIIGILLLSKPK